MREKNIKNERIIEGFLSKFDSFLYDMSNESEALKFNDGCEMVEFFFYLIKADRSDYELHLQTRQILAYFYPVNQTNYVHGVSHDSTT